MGRPQSPGSPFRIAWDMIEYLHQLAEEKGDLKIYKKTAEYTARLAHYSDRQGQNRAATPDGKKPEEKPEEKPKKEQEAKPTTTKPLPENLSSEGHYSPGDAFAFSMRGGVDDVVAVWVREYTDAKGTAPTITNLDKSQIRAHLGGLSQEKLSAGFKAFLAHKWHGDRDMHTIPIFCKDPGRWINASAPGKPKAAKEDDYQWQE